MADARSDEIKKWMQFVVDGVTSGVAAMMANRPAQSYGVTRIGPNGTPQPQAITLPQALCDLTDQLRVENGIRQIEMDMRRAEIETMVRLREELEKSRKVGESTLREIRRQGKRGEDSE